MWIRRIATGLLLITFSLSAWAKKNEVVFFGGGGEPAGPGTIFDSTYNNFALFRFSGSWQARSYFNGGHPRSEAIARSKFNDRNKPMTAKNMVDEIASLKSRILNGQLKKGDQVMLTLATHGLPKEGKQNSHSITTTDANFDVDELIKLRDVAEKNGVSLAILDLSCYSGNTLKLGTDKTCVISMAGDALAYNYSGRAMAQRLLPGFNLEQAFLMARKDEDAVVPAAPQISSEVGRKTYELTKILSESMQERSVIKTTKETGPACYGTNSKPYKKLLNSLVDIESSTDFFRYLKVRFNLAKPQMEELMQKLQSAMRKYEDRRKGVQKTFDEMKDLESSNRCRDVLEYQLCGDMNNWAYGYKLLKEKDAQGTLDSRGRAELAAYQAFVNGPEFKRWETLKATYGKQGTLFSEAKEVAKVEREVYDVLYKEFSKQEKKPNPCRSFVL